MIKRSRAKASSCNSDVIQALVTTTLILICWTPNLACAAATSPSSSPSSSSAVVGGGERSVNRTTTVRCLPVAHDVLWKRLRLIAADLDRFRTTTDATDQPLLEIGSTVTMRNASLEPQAVTVVGASPGQTLQSSTSSDQLQSTERRSPDTIAAPEESNRIPDEEATEEHSSAHELNDRSDLHPRLDRLLRERTLRRLRRNKRLRRRRRLMTSIFRKTSWHCRMSKYWKRMPPGIFPSYVQTARCRQRTCMLGMFECRPRKYRIKLLRRNDGVCSPLPSVSSGSDYEETWTFVEYKVVVGCECSRKYGPGSYSRHLQDSKKS